MANKKPSFLSRLAAFIVDKRKGIFVLFLILAAFCAFSRNWVSVNDDLTAFLSEDTETRKGLSLMDEEFVTFATANIMVQNITYQQADALYEAIEEVEGVKSVLFDDTPNHYSSASALFSVTFDGGNEDEVSILALDRVEQLLSAYDVYVSSEVGNPLKAIVSQEMLVVDLLAVAVIVLVLLFTSRTYAEVPVLLITFGAAALRNMGTNFIFGEISFVTNAIAVVLQLALAIDYAIILCHRYTEEREKAAPREAAVTALSKAIPEISASSLTTIAGLVALTFMQYRLGYDLGIVLIKAIVLSLLSVFLLMPGLLVTFSRAIDRTHHRSFVPKIPFLGRFAFATRYIVPVVFVAVIIVAYLFSHRAPFVYSQYSVEAVRKNETTIANENIDATFGKRNVLAILIPTGSYEEEAKMIEELEVFPQVISVTGLANIEVGDDYVLTDRLTPRQFAELTDLDYELARTLYAGYAVNNDDSGQAATGIDSYTISLIDLFTYINEKRDDVSISMSQELSDDLDELAEQLDDARLQLQSDSWSRIVLELDLPVEGEASYEFLNILRGIVAREYSEFYFVGDTTSCRDLRDSFEHDNLLISVLTILFVIAVLLLSFRSVGLPLLLILIIQGSIWINFAIATLKGTPIFFLCYLIVSAIQMGANIDYAIVVSSRYTEFRQTMDRRDAMITTLNLAFPTVITSGLMMVCAGLLIGFQVSQCIIAGMGYYVGTGTSISIVLILFALPQLLLLGDRFVALTTINTEKLALLRFVRRNRRRFAAGLLAAAALFALAMAPGVIRLGVEHAERVGEQSEMLLSQTGELAALSDKLGADSTQAEELKYKFTEQLMTDEIGTQLLEEGEAQYQAGLDEYN
ncbi:MAG: MMPL family transporter, partial [Oscillospiraceae bacterium]|nr:MMPL family transporter [Oscillospiraceae bacterium]